MRSHFLDSYPFNRALSDRDDLYIHRCGVDERPRAGRQGPASAPRVWPPSFFPLPACVIDAASGRLACEHILGIYVSHECLARRRLHSHVALRSYVSLIREVERRELRNTVADRQSRCHREIWASRSRGTHVLGETTNVGSIVVSRRSDRRSRRITGRRRRGRGRGLLRSASSDRESGNT